MWKSYEKIACTVLVFLMITGLKAQEHRYFPELPQTVLSNQFIRKHKLKTHLAIDACQDTFALEKYDENGKYIGGMDLRNRYRAPTG